MTLSQLILVLIMVESGGNDSAIGDGGMSYGPLQIQQAYIDDVNQFTGSSWVHNDAFDRKKAIIIFRGYMQRYATKARLGHSPTIEDIARIHNGGPNGYKRKSTLPYWTKVKKEMLRN